MPGLKLWTTVGGDDSAARAAKTDRRERNKFPGAFVHLPGRFGRKEGLVGRRIVISGVDIGRSVVEDSDDRCGQLVPIPLTSSRKGRRCARVRGKRQHTANNLSFVVQQLVFPSANQPRRRM